MIAGRVSSSLDFACNLDSDLSIGANECWRYLPKSRLLAGSGASQQVDKVADAWHFSKIQRLAHTVLQARNLSETGASGQSGSNKDFAFESLQKIAFASWDFAEGIEKLGRALVVVIPCIVIDGPLFAAHFDYDKSEFEVTPVEHGRLLWRGCRSGTLVDVVQISSVNNYAARVKMTFDKLTELLTGSF